MKLKKNQYLIIAFIEGIAVMSCEFLGAKIMAPFYGTSLFVWTSVIGVTMFSLSLGYYIGGALSERYNGFKILSWSVFGGSSGLLIMPLLAPKIMLLTSGLGLYAGAVLSAFLLISPALICFSMINPVIINLSVGRINKSGNVTGNIYALSTIGAVISTLIIGFYIIPEWGGKFPVLFMVLGLLIFLFVIMYKFTPPGKYRKRYYPTGILLFMIILLSKFYFTSPELSRQDKIIYESEGILGQISVVDHYFDYHGLPSPNRMLYVNRIPQTNVDLPTGFSRWLYVHRIATASSVKPAGSKVLLLGIGGGSLVKEFVDLGFHVDICELDKRMIEVSKKFNVPVSSANIFIDDARHYIKTTKNKYDIVVFDIAWGEIQPSHLFTLEAFQELRKLLINETAFVFIHYTDHGGDMMAFRSIYRTMMEAGFVINTFVSRKGDDKVCLALLKKPDSDSFKPDRLNKCCERFANLNVLLAMEGLDTKDALILKDDMPVLDILNFATTSFYRDQAINRFVSKQIRKR